MMLQTLPSIGLLDIHLSAVPIYPQNLVIVLGLAPL